MGRPRKPENEKYVIMSFRMDPNLRKNIELIADADGVTLTEVAIGAITRYVDTRLSNPNFMNEVVQGLEARKQQIATGQQLMNAQLNKDQANIEARIAALGNQ